MNKAESARTAADDAAWEALSTSPSLTMVPTGGQRAGAPSNGSRQLTTETQSEAPWRLASAAGVASLTRTAGAVIDLTSTHAGLMRQLDEQSRAAEELRRRMRLEEQSSELAIGAALSNELGLFILMKVAGEPEGVSLEALSENLEAPEGWLALARLLRADLLNENTRSVYATELAANLLAGLHHTDGAGGKRP